MILIESLINFGDSYYSGKTGGFDWYDNLSKLFIALIGIYFGYYLYKKKRNDDYDRDEKNRIESQKLEEIKKAKEKEKDYEYFTNSLNSILVHIKEQYEYYKNYSDGFENSLIGKTPLKLNTFYNLKVFLDLEHSKYFEAYNYKFKDESEFKKINDDFNSIYTNLSEFMELYEMANKAHNEFIYEFRNQSMTLMNKYYIDDLQMSILNLKYNFKNEALKDEILNLFIETHNERLKIDSTNQYLHYSKDKDLEIINNSAKAIFKKINESDELHKDDLITKIFFDCTNIMYLYARFVDKSKGMKVIFDGFYTQTKERYDNLPKLSQ